MEGIEAELINRCPKVVQAHRTEIRRLLERARTENSNSQRQHMDAWFIRPIAPRQSPYYSAISDKQSKMYLPFERGDHERDYDSRSRPTRLERCSPLLVSQFKHANQGSATGSKFLGAKYEPSLYGLGVERIGMCCKGEGGGSA